MNTIEKSQYIINNNNFMIIASADKTGKPWVSPVGFAIGPNYNLYWVSSKNALHSKNINLRPEIAISIFGKMPDESYDGVYIEAEAFELVDELDIHIGIDLFKKQRPQPSRFETKVISDVTGKAIWRMYKAVPKQISKRADDTLNGQAITIREIVQL